MFPAQRVKSRLKFNINQCRNDKITGDRSLINLPAGGVKTRRRRLFTAKKLVPKKITRPSIRPLSIRSTRVALYTILRNQFAFQLAQIKVSPLCRATGACTLACLTIRNFKARFRRKKKERTQLSTRLQRVIPNVYAPSDNYVELEDQIKDERKVKNKKRSNATPPLTNAPLASRETNGGGKQR